MIDPDWLTTRLADGASYATLAREADCSPTTIATHARRLGLRSTHATRHAPKGALDEPTLRTLVAQRRSIRQIATTLDRSPTTIRHWLARLGLETSSTQRRREGALALAAASDEVILPCPAHGPTRHIRRAGGFRCATCRSVAVTERRRRIKRILLDEAGGSCVLCGYDRCVAALHFHHIDPTNKAFAVAASGVTRSLAAARVEARKCVVLCANCHAEVESGLTDVPVRSGEPVRTGNAVPVPG